MSARYNLKISLTGGKWWRLKYRFDGKEKRLSLGVYPDVSLKDARDRRDAARKLVADGIDPSEHRKAQKSARADRAANSFEVVAREWFAKYSATWATNHGGSARRSPPGAASPWPRLLGRRAPWRRAGGNGGDNAKRRHRGHCAGGEGRFVAVAAGALPGVSGCHRRSPPRRLPR